MISFQREKNVSFTVFYNRHDPLFNTFNAFSKLFTQLPQHQPVWATQLTQFLFFWHKTHTFTCLKLVLTPFKHKLNQGQNSRCYLVNFQLLTHGLSNSWQLPGLDKACKEILPKMPEKTSGVKLMEICGPMTEQISFFSSSFTVISSFCVFDKILGYMSSIRSG